MMKAGESEGGMIRMMRAGRSEEETTRMMNTEAVGGGTMIATGLAGNQVGIATMHDYGSAHLRRILDRLLRPLGEGHVLQLQDEDHQIEEGRTPQAETLATMIADMTSPTTHLERKASPHLANRIRKRSASVDWLRCRKTHLGQSRSEKSV